MYYYRRKANPLKWVIILIIIVAIGGFGYWFYINYFSKIEFPKEQVLPAEIKPAENTAKILNLKLAESKGEVNIDFENKGYEKAISESVLHQGDKIKTGDQSYVILKFEDNSLIRLGAQTEISLQNLAENDILIEQTMGRTYHNLNKQNKYQIKYANASVSSLGTKFEIITNEKINYLAVLVFENKVNVTISDNNDIMLAGRLDPNEKALVDLKAVKKDMFKIENFELQTLIKDPWYKWNFDLDKGLTENLQEEPNFSTTTESLELAAETKENGIYLSWSNYNKDDFKSYELMRSETNSDLKYPDTEAIKTSLSKDFNSFLDSKAEKNKQYYYRVCVVKINNNVVCGNVVKVQAAAEEKDMVAPVAPVLSAVISAEGVQLSWTQNSEKDFKEYLVVKSLTNSLLSYPGEGALAIKNLGSESYLDREVNITSAGNVYYRICSMDLSGNIACSNIIKIENGQMK
ncbi:MAG: FecR family protein [Candidatus Parcubacteria bacterium]|nr:FecR family protein [Candidatus Parcubacteria bacterium]